MKYWKRFRQWWRQYRCDHLFFIEDIERVSEDEVKCACHNCGEVHHAPYGLALNSKGRLAFKRRYPG